MFCFPQQKRKNKRPDFMKQLLFSTLFLLLVTSCVERGKPVKKEDVATESNTKKKKVDHYTCPKGHKGANQQGTCSECNSVLVHNQAFHGNNLAIPKPTLQDPFNASPATNNAPSPAQNAFGDYHYTCPNGHSGGSGTNGNCTTCNTKLIHNQVYHK